MTKWKYYILYGEVSDYDLQDGLNDLGKDGWELFKSHYLGDKEVMFIFKKKLVKKIKRNRKVVNMPNSRGVPIIRKGLNRCD
jgi:hypothetical protein